MKRAIDIVLGVLLGGMALFLLGTFGVLPGWGDGPSASSEHHGGSAEGEAPHRGEGEHAGDQPSTSEGEHGTGQPHTPGGEREKGSPAPLTLRPEAIEQIGRASCRERVYCEV